ncbi:SAM-dependent methyltransferase [uncultured Rhodococcus sp.]|uniref:SAM-dependent methyltransferase n=1 Tax=uncultured Rhodococcus sp. TaxID=194249 RepID=UPI0028DC0F80|nr:SAM-dependent methyltransferase [uncultured Rhodococcus sp.]
MDARDWDERYRAVTEPWGVDPAGTVATRISDLRPGTAIDLACGDGRHARWMAGQGWSVTAVDHLAATLNRVGQWVAPGGRVLYLGHSIENFHRGVGGPPEPTILPGISDLARAAEGSRVYALEHVVRSQDGKTAIDVLLEFGPWEQV